MKKKGTIGTEQQILQAAEEVFMQKGFAGARMVEIARRAGVGHPLLHYYFDTKEHLFRKVFQAKFALFSGEILSALELDNTSVVDKICAMMAHHFDFLCNNSRLPVFIINALNDNPELADGIMGQVHHLVSGIIAQLQSELDVAAQQGEIAPISAQVLLLDIFNMNFATFTTLPILSRSFSLFDMHGDNYLAMRKQENITLIRKRLKP